MHVEVSPPVFETSLFVSTMCPLWTLTGSTCSPQSLLCQRQCHTRIYIWQWSVLMSKMFHFNKCHFVQPFCCVHTVTQCELSWILFWYMYTKFTILCGSNSKFYQLWNGSTCWIKHSSFLSQPPMACADDRKSVPCRLTIWVWQKLNQIKSK